MKMKTKLLALLVLGTLATGLAAERVLRKEEAVVVNADSVYLNNAAGSGNYISYGGKMLARENDRFDIDETVTVGGKKWYKLQRPKNQRDSLAGGWLHEDYVELRPKYLSFLRQETKSDREQLMRRIDETPVSDYDFFYKIFMQEKDDDVLEKAIAAVEKAGDRRYNDALFGLARYRMDWGVETATLAALSSFGDKRIIPLILEQKIPKYAILDFKGESVKHLSDIMERVGENAVIQHMWNKRRVERDMYNGPEGTFRPSSSPGYHLTDAAKTDSQRRYVFGLFEEIAMDKIYDCRDRYEAYSGMEYLAENFGIGRDRIALLNSEGLQWGYRNDLIYNYLYCGDDRINLGL